MFDVSQFHNMDKETVDLISDLIYSDTYKSLQCFLDRLDILFTNETSIGVKRRDVSGDLFDKDFLKEVQNFCETGVSLHFGKTLRDLKCVISDENIGELVLWIQYIGPNNLQIRDMDLPQSDIQNQVYRSIYEVVNVFKKHVGELSNYFNELSRIDTCCTVMEPVRPTLKDNYRKIQIADKIWLHVEVSPDGSAKNRYVLGQLDQTEMNELLQAWDDSKDIATNIIAITSSLNNGKHSEINQEVTVPECAICYCVELPGDKRVPQPLCGNTQCGTYFHTSCLYEWLVACEGGRMPKFTVGKCPNCSEYIRFSERDIRQ